MASRIYTGRQSRTDMDAGAEEHREVNTSADTNPFTASEWEAVQDRGLASGKPHSLSVENEVVSSRHRTPHQPQVHYDRPEEGAHSDDMRLVLHSPTKDLFLQVSSTWTSSDQSHRPGAVIFDLSTDLGLMQSTSDTGFSFRVGSREGTEEPKTLLHQVLLDFEVHFDPHTDRVVIRNKLDEPMITKSLELEEPCKAHKISKDGLYFLGVGRWALIPSGRHQHGHEQQESQQLNLSITQRRQMKYLQATAPVVRASKRAIGDLESQTVDIQKRTRANVPACPSFDLQGTPTTGPAIVAEEANREAIATAKVAEQPLKQLTLSDRHSLEQLELGDVVEITGPSGEGYNLTRGETILHQTNSVVFGALCSNIPGNVAIKIVRSPPATDNPERAAPKIVRVGEHWLREVKNHAKVCQHTAVVRLYDSDARFFSLCMEHIDAPALSSYREKKQNNTYSTLEIEDAERILCDMSDALLYIHRQGIVHNDIKPANILYSNARGAVLIDFGLSSEGHDQTLVTGGSPWYIPPEYAVNGRRGEPGDVFALGVVMLFAIREIPLPESHHPPLNWTIANIVRRGDVARRARETKACWLDIVERAASAAQSRSAKEELLAGELIARMLRAERNERIDVDHLQKLTEVLKT